MRISDWSSDVCSSDLQGHQALNFSRNAALWIIIVLLLFALFNFFQSNMSRTTQEGIPYSTFLDNVQSGRVSSVTIQGSDISGVDSEGRSFTTRATDNLDGLVPTLRERSDEHTSELQSLMRISYAVFCLKKQNII